MKKILLLNLSIIAFGAAQAEGHVGKYSYPHKVAMVYSNAKECVVEERGEWEDGYCLLDSADEVELTSDSVLKVFTVTTNAHMCDFEEKGTFISPNVFVSQTQVDIYENGEVKKATCEVRAEFLLNTVSITATEQCSNFCGMNASLEIESAKKIK